MDDTEQLLQTRGEVYGDYATLAVTAQRLKEAMERAPCWSSRTDMERESLDLIASKIARILNNHVDQPDSWADIAGYARLPWREYMADEFNPGGSSSDD